MVRKQSVSARLPRLLFSGAVVVTLSACGGGGGAGDGGIDQEPGVILGDTDINGDGIVDTSFGDVDGDGFEDFDVNGDGNFDTPLGFGDFDTNSDGFADFDADGDGTVDASVVDDDGALAGFDSDGDGTADLDVNGDALGPNFTEPSAAFPCGSADGDDPNSSTNSWADNCNISQASQFNTSLYTVGIQRIVWCAGFQGDSGASTVDAFADGIWGENTQLAVEDFQASRGLVDDGIVGPITWQALRDELTEDPLSFATGGGTEPYGVQGDRCANTELFLNTVSFENNAAVMGGWQLTTSSTNPAPRAFSIGAP